LLLLAVAVVLLDFLSLLLVAVVLVGIEQEQDWLLQQGKHIQSQLVLAVLALQIQRLDLTDLVLYFLLSLRVVAVVEVDLQVDLVAVDTMVVQVVQEI
jgi:hypothetical protein